MVTKEQKEALLWRLEGLSNEETAKKLGISKAGVRKRLEGIYVPEAKTTIDEFIGLVDAGVITQEDLDRLAPERLRRKVGSLSSREQEVMDRLTTFGGNTVRYIADKLVITDQTVDFHLNKIYQKLGIAPNHLRAAVIGLAARRDRGDFGTPPNPPDLPTRRG